MKDDMDYDMDDMSDKKMGKDKKIAEYEVKHACDVLIEAEMIKKNSELMKLVKPKLAEKMGAMKKITSLDELKAVAKEKMEE